jgi:hypothetical protein
LIVVTILASYLLWRGLDRPVFAPRAAYVPLAGVILIAQAVERLLEPVSDYLVSKQREEEHHDNKARDIANACADVAKGHAYVQPLADEMAAAKAQLARRVNERKIWFWAIATGLAALAAATTGVFLINSVGTTTGSGNDQSTHVSCVFDLALTSLVVGAGTKPLHELIKSLSSAEAAPPTAT